MLQNRISKWMTVCALLSCNISAVLPFYIEVENVRIGSAYLTGDGDNKTKNKTNKLRGP
jgi:hypothetical protein